MNADVYAATLNVVLALLAAAGAALALVRWRPIRGARLACRALAGLAVLVAAVAAWAHWRAAHEASTLSQFAREHIAVFGLVAAGLVILLAARHRGRGVSPD